MNPDKTLCKKLYELSHWGYGKTDWVWCHGTLKSQGSVDTREVHDHYPAYTLEYLLERLPKFVYGGEFWMTNDGLSWTAGYATDKYADGNFHFLTSETGDTPNNAALKLCISLIESGEIKV